MTRGMRAVTAALADAGDVTAPGKRLILAGKTLVSTVGGASGPLWGTALRRGGRALGDAEALDGAGARRRARGGAGRRRQELGAAEPGDKTMVDALGPAVAALRERLEAGDSLADAVAAAADAAEEGARATTPHAGPQGPRVLPGRALGRPPGPGRDVDRADHPGARTRPRHPGLMAESSPARASRPRRGSAVGRAPRARRDGRRRARPSPRRAARRRSSARTPRSRRPPPSSRPLAAAAAAATRRRSSAPAS